MKKVIWISIFLLLIVLSGCGNSNDEKPATDSDTNNQSEENNDGTEKENGTEDNNNADVDDNQDAGESLGADDNQDANTEDETVTPTYKIDQETWSVVPIDDSADEDVLLLTIDDAPDEHALEMAHTLKDLDANAIFFVNGHFLETDEEKETIKEIHDMGFLIGNHTYSHPDLSDLSPEEQREEIIKVSDMIEEAIGERPAFFRAPHGIIPDTTREVVEEEDMVLMNWTYGYDYFEPYMDKEKITEAMISGEGPEVGVEYSLLKSGANLLMHDRDWTNAALEDIVTGLRDKGYEMVDPKLIETKK